MMSVPATHDECAGHSSLAVKQAAAPVYVGVGSPIHNTYTTRARAHTRASVYVDVGSHIHNTYTTRTRVHTRLGLCRCRITHTHYARARRWVQPYLDPPAGAALARLLAGGPGRPAVRVRYADYDWSLNKAS